MRIRAIALVIGLSAAFAACTATSSSSGPDDPGEPGSPSTPTPTVEAPDVDFSATLSPAGDELAIEWSLTNRSADELLVTNRVPDTYGRLSERPDTAYVVATADGTEVAKRVFPVSSDAGGDALPWIGVTILPPGETLEETLRVPLPPEAYAPPTVDAGDVPVSGPVVFCVGVLVGRDPSWGFHDVDGVTTVNHGRAGAGQATFCSDPVEIG